MVHPVVDFLRGHAERHSREESKGWVLANVVVRSSVERISGTGGHSIESSLRTGNQFAVCLQVNFQRAAGDRCYVVSNALSGIVYTKGAAAPGGYHGYFFTALSQCWSGETGSGRCTCSNASYACAFKKLATFHRKSSRNGQLFRIRPP